MSRGMRSEIRNYMLQEIKYHVDPITNEANLTAMAEDAIDALAGSDWELWYDESHVVWDVAVEVAEETGHGIVT